MQNTWNEADDADLREHIEEQKITMANLSREEILTLSLDSLQAIDVLFCDTAIIQHLLKLHRVLYCPPPTYSTRFTPFYHRSIKRLSIRDAIDKMPPPFFVKPATQSKCFDGFVVENQRDFDYLRDVTSSLNEIVYCCDVVDFVSEFRLFVARGKIFGVVESSSYVIADYEKIRSSSPPPNAFVNQILAATPWAYCVIDVGQLRSGQWAVVETNPPFALSSYDWPVNKYYAYCVDAWQAIIRGT